MPIVSCTVPLGSDDTGAWQVALRCYEREHSQGRSGNPAPRKPRSTPWLAVQLHPGMFQSPLEEIKMLGDFERCFAWAILEEYWQP